MKLALLQSRPMDDVKCALKAIESRAQEAKAAEADILITPEAFLGGYNIGKTQMAMNAGFAKEMMKAAASVAARHGIALALGLPVLDHGAVKNAALLIDKHGVLLTEYHKTHLFGDIDTTLFAPGHALGSVIDLNGWRTALAICYDIEFPEVARHYAHAGAELVIVPTANMEPFDGVSKRLVPARAEENAIYIAYTNYVGHEGAIHYNGASVVVGPDGEDILRMHSQEGLFFATIDRDFLMQTRQRQTHLKDRRAELYDI